MTESKASKAAPKAAPKEEKAAPKKVVDCKVRCDYCRASHTTIYEPGSIGDTVISLHERKLLETEIPFEKLVTGKCICPGCGTKVPMRIRTDQTTAFMARQGIR